MSVSLSGRPMQRSPLSFAVVRGDDLCQTGPGCRVVDGAAHGGGTRSERSHARQKPCAGSVGDTPFGCSGQNFVERQKRRIGLTRRWIGSIKFGEGGAARQRGYDQGKGGDAAHGAGPAERCGNPSACKAGRARLRGVQAVIVLDGVELNVCSDKALVMARRTGSHSEITGPRVRAAAERLFARHGYAAVSMRQIAAEVGVQAGALYLYTPDKQSLLADLMQGHMQDLLAAWSLMPKPEAHRDRLEGFARFHIGFHLDRPDAVFIAYMELRNLEPDNFRAIEALRRRYEDELEAILRAGRDAGAFAIPDTKLATLALIAMLTGVTNWYREGGRLSRATVEDIYADMVLKAVGA